jgi:3-oxoacyl-[acyl-carrier-protein] synthase II
MFIMAGRFFQKNSMGEIQTKPRVVITGIGVVASLGTGLDEFWSSLISGKSGTDRIARFDTTEYTCKVASEVIDFNASDWMDAKEAKRNDRYTHFAMAASKLALDEGEIDPSKFESSRFGVLIGSGIGGIETIQNQSKILHERGPRRVSPFMIPSLIANIAGGVVAIELGARGPNFAVVSACASGTHAIGESVRLIQNGEADVMLAGGSEAAITELGFSGFCSMRAMSTNFNDDPTHASRPFDAARDGFVMGEGAGVLVLETLEHAQARGAKVHCEIIGYAATCDAYHITSPDVESRGLSQCIQNAIQDASVEKEDINYINAHGTSTPYNDHFETNAVKKVFGEHAYKLKMSSTKSMTGHLLGAAGAIEAATCCKVLETGTLPPTINYETADPDCDLDYVVNEARQAEADVVMSNNSGFGGQNASLIFRKI